MTPIKAVLEELVSKCWISEDGKIFNIQNKLEIDKALISIAKIVEKEKHSDSSCGDDWDDGWHSGYNQAISDIAEMIRGGGE